MRSCASDAGGVDMLSVGAVAGGHIDGTTSMLWIVTAASSDPLTTNSLAASRCTRVHRQPALTTRTCVHRSSRLDGQSSTTHHSSLAASCCTRAHSATAFGKHSPHVTCSNVLHSRRLGHTHHLQHRAAVGSVVLHGSSAARLETGAT